MKYAVELCIRSTTSACNPPYLYLLGSRTPTYLLYILFNWTNRFYRISTTTILCCERVLPVENKGTKYRGLPHENLAIIKGGYKTEPISSSGLFLMTASSIPRSLIIVCFSSNHPVKKIYHGIIQDGYVILYIHVLYIYYDINKLIKNQPILTNFSAILLFNVPNMCWR